MIEKQQDMGASADAARSGGLRPEPRSESQPKALVPSAKEIFARAGEIVDERYPAGCAKATVLAGIVREAIAELMPSTVRQIAPQRHNSLSMLPEARRSIAVRICRETIARERPDWKACVDERRDFICHRCQDLAAAQAIEARRAETHSGSVHESAVGNADAPNLPPENPNDP